ncbi:MAG: hypothetical protein K5644_08205 [Lachnospiraceae bacterium]|nr:hypothetical protein [Lachnospiraceae bacterium]
MKKVNKINAVLVELILVILFFAISSIITIQLFAKSYSITSESSAKTKLTMVVESQMNEYRNKTAPEGNRVLYYDDKLNICDKQDATYTEEITAVNDDKLPIVNVKVKVVDAGNNDILSFDTSYERQV